VIATGTNAVAVAEAQRKEANAKWMAVCRASMAQRKKQIAENRRGLEAKSRKAAARALTR
jgi:hypothetical protein